MARHSLRRTLPWLLALGGTAYVLFVLTRTTWAQGVYIATVRDMYFGCMQPADTGYVYRMAPGRCQLKNLEYDSTMTHDADGFRNTAPPAPAPVAARVAVLGDSHAYGHGVNDDQTFASLLASQLAQPVRNLALPATATRRELEAYAVHAPAAEFVVLQYCDNDIDENPPSLSMASALYRQTLRDRMGAVIKNYEFTKQQGGARQALMSVAYAVQQLVQARLWRLPSVEGDESTLGREADAFASVLQAYQPLLQGKTVVVLESSGWGRNRKNFQRVFAQRLQALPQVHSVVLDSPALLDRSDYFWLDDHLNASGHRKLAAHLAHVLRPLLAAAGSAP